jgi:tetratricopeptide (TPR) repeat protein
MTGQHLSFDDLVRASEGEELPVAIHEHLGACDSCRLELRLLQRMESHWDGEGTAESGTGATEDEELTRRSVVEFGRQITREDEEARELLEPLLSTTTGTYALGIARRGARYRTGGVVRVLCGAAREALAENPLKALILADEAIAIAAALSDHEYPSHHVEVLRGNAWKERANALRFQGESYDAALDAVDHAERAYRRLPLPEFYLATCDYVRSTILFRMDRFDEALAHSRRAAGTFLTFRDVQRYIHALSIEGNVLFDTARYAEARAVFERVLAAAETTGDAATAVGFAINLAASELELGMLQSASQRLTNALEVSRIRALGSLGLCVRWILATVPLRAGRPVDAARELLTVFNECRAHNMIGTATGVALDLAEAYSLIPRPADVVPICTWMIQDFLSRGQLTSAMTAFAYLRDAAAHGTLRTEDVRHVKRFVARLERQPALLFLPPR